MKTFLLAFSVLFLTACKDDNVYTLYRDSPIVNVRVHIATFDAGEKPPYNEETCEYTRQLYNDNPDFIANYWCEAGAFTK
jgi:hypothetical protein